jgi:hypothetical protein
MSSLVVWSVKYTASLAIAAPTPRKYIKRSENSENPLSPRRRRDSCPGDRARGASSHTERRERPSRSGRQAGALGCVHDAGAHMQPAGCADAAVPSAACGCARDDRPVRGDLADGSCPIEKYVGAARSWSRVGHAWRDRDRIRRGRRNSATDGRHQHAGTQRRGNRFSQPHQLVMGREPLVHSGAQSCVACTGRIRCRVCQRPQEPGRCNGRVGKKPGAEW